MIRQARLAAFLQGLQQLGWIDGGNARIDTRWAAGNSDYTRKYLAELLTLAPDVILAAGSQSVGPLLQTTRAVPIVFVHVPDPVGAGFVDSLARPGRNATGFTLMEYSTSGKWLELLKEIAPGVTRVAVIRDSAITGGIGQWASIQSMAPSVGVEIIPVNMPDAAEIERSVMAFARGANGGLILTASGSAFVHHGLIIALAARYKLPAVYFERFFVAKGGLILRAFSCPHSPTSRSSAARPYCRPRIKAAVCHELSCLPPVFAPLPYPCRYRQGSRTGMLPVRASSRTSPHSDRSNPSVGPMPPYPPRTGVRRNSTNVLRTLLRSNVERLITLRTSAVAVCCCSNFAQLAEQPRVLDGDDGLAAKVL